MKIKDENFLKEILQTSSFKIGNLVISLVISILIARGLGPEGKGLFSLIMLTIGLVVTLLKLGIGKSNTYYISKNPVQLPSIFGNTIVSVVFLGGGGMIVGYFIFKKSPDTFYDISKIYLLLILLLIPIRLLISSLVGIFLGIGNILYYNLITFTQNLFYFIILLLLFITIKPSIKSVIIALFLSTIIALILSLYKLKHLLSNFSLNLELLKKQILYGIQIHMSNLIDFFLFRIDFILINLFLGTVYVGYYSIGVNLIEKIWLIPMIIGALLFPRVARSPGNNFMIWKIFKIILIIYIPLLIILYILSPKIIVILYSTRYCKSVNVFRILLISVLPISLSRILINDISARGRPILNFYTSVFSSLINIVLNLFTIPKFGINGAAISSVVSFHIDFLIRIYIFSKLIQYRLSSNN